MKKFAFLALFILTGAFAATDELSETSNSEKVAVVPRPKSMAAADQAPNEMIAVVPPPSAGKVYGLLELRPSVSAKSGVLGSENTFEAGYQFNPTWRVTYTQWFNTTRNLSEGVYAHDGFIRIRGNNLYTNGRMSVSYQGRVFLPTYSVRRDAGFITSSFNQLMVAFQLTPELNLSFASAPTYQQYSRPATNGKLNAIFQNQGLINLDIKLSSRLLVSLPVYIISNRNYDVAGLKGSGEWNHLVMIWPELDYSLNDNHTIGVAYYSDNLMSPNLDRFKLANGFDNGVIQAFWNVRL